MLQRLSKLQSRKRNRSTRFAPFWLLITMVWLEPSLSVALGHSVEVSGQSPKMTVKSVSSCFLYLFFIQSVVTAWDNEELELFDLVEEVSANFYDVLEVSRVNLSDIMCLQLSYRIDVKPNCVFWKVNGE